MSRDLRDPQELGLALWAHKDDLIEGIRKQARMVPGAYITPRMSEVYDDAMRRGLSIPDVPKEQRTHQAPSAVEET